MDGKPKKYKVFFRGGGGWRHGPALTGKFFHSHILRPKLSKSADMLSLDNKLISLIPIVHVSKKEHCIYSTVQK